MREGLEFSQWREEIFHMYPVLKANIEKWSTLSCPEKTPVLVKTDHLCPRYNQRTAFLGNHVNILNHSFIKGSQRVRSSLFTSQQHCRFLYHWSPELVLSRKNCFLSWKQAQWSTEGIHRWSQFVTNQENLDYTKLWSFWLTTMHHNLPKLTVT